MGGSDIPRNIKHFKLHCVSTEGIILTFLHQNFIRLPSNISIKKISLLNYENHP